MLLNTLRTALWKILDFVLSARGAKLGPVTESVSSREHLGFKGHLPGASHFGGCFDRRGFTALPASQSCPGLNTVAEKFNNQDSEKLRHLL